jgi:peptidyl-prolyl cis-trans isomerase A (cyclophilin A)
MDVVRKIWNSPVSPTAGQGAMKGQLLAPEIKVLTVRRSVMPVSAPAATANAAP